jgi:hypothetical protein
VGADGDDGRNGFANLEQLPGKMDVLAVGNRERVPADVAPVGVIDDLDAATMSASAPPGTMGAVCRKSPAKTTTAPPNGMFSAPGNMALRSIRMVRSTADTACTCIMEISSQTNISAATNSSPRSDARRTLQ